MTILTSSGKRLCQSRRFGSKELRRVGDAAEQTGLARASRAGGDLQQADIYDSDLVMKLLALILEGLGALFSTEEQLRPLVQKLDQS